jgi:SAM-dependent methyltransferase
VAASRVATWEWLLAKVARSSAVVEAAAGGTSGPRLRELSAGLKAEVRARLLEDEPDLEAALELIDVAAVAYPAFLRGDISGDDVLLRPESSGLWERYFANTNPLYAPVNRLTAFVACRLLEERREAKVALLEVGAGCGSASEALLQGVAADPALGAEISYRITDVAPAFLREARERVERILSSLRAANSRPTPDVSYGLLDLNHDFERWRVAENSIDLVLAVNVLHTVRDLGASLRGIRRALRPGGQLLLGECVRPAPGQGVHPEFVFQLIATFREVKASAPHRASWGFLDGIAWREALSDAGFAAVSFVPDFPAAVAAYPEHTLAAIVAA